VQRLLKGNGTCGCGCGQVPTQYKQHHVPHGIKPGDFRRFVAGHGSRRPGDPRNAGPDFIVEDRGYKTPCHIWQRGLSHNGYGQISGKRAHVVYWEREHGPMPEGTEPDHLCSQPACVNADHIEAVPHVINVRRSRATRLSQDQVDGIRARAGSVPQAALALEFGVSQSQISRIVNYNRWKDVV
jgi:hypothetical protein